MYKKYACFLGFCGAIGKVGVVFDVISGDKIWGVVRMIFFLVLVGNINCIQFC